MPKKFILTLLVFFIALFTFLFVKRSTDNNAKPYPIFHKKVLPTLSSQMGTLTILPNPPIVLSGQNGSADIILETNAKPDLVQLEIAYNPNALSIINITPGNFLKDPIIALKKIDVKNGRISYALKGEPIAGAKILATIAFTPLAATQQETTFSFLPKTSIKVQGEEIVLKEMTSSSVMLKPSFSLPVSSSAAIVPQP